MSTSSSAEPFCLSTAWAPWLWPTLGKTVRAGVQLGFRRFELGVSRASFSLRRALALADRLGIAFCCVHNVCSEHAVDPDNRRGAWLGSLDEERRRETVHLTLETARIARELGASALVLHLGRIEPREALPSRDELVALLRSEDRSKLEQVRQARRSLGAAALQAAERSLAELCAKIDDLALCIEIPYCYHEIPHWDELAVLLERLDAANVRYWHDFGHAHSLEQLGVARHEDWLRAFGPKLHGAHVHDAVGFRDHQPPGYGEVDLPRLMPLLPEQSLKVIEISGEFAADELRNGLRLAHEILRRALGATRLSDRSHC